MRLLSAALVVAMVAHHATQPAMAQLFGVDVSTHQGFVNWNSMASAGIEYGFVKATEGVDFVDNRFTQNMTNARAAGVPIGPYHFARIDSFVGTLADINTEIADAVNEANDFVDAIEPYYTTYPDTYLRPVLDVENIPTTAEINTTSERRQYMSEWVRDFNGVVQDRLQTDVIIYTSRSYAQTYFESDLASLDLWIAKPNGLGSPPTAAEMGIWNDYAFWQYSWTENIGGESPVDANYFQGSLGDLQQDFFYAPQDPGFQGDFNGNGIVDAADFTVWRDNYNDRFNIPGNPADANGDGFVNDLDYDIWEANFGAVNPNPAVAVPEPGAALMGLMAVGFMHRRQS